MTPLSIFLTVRDTLNDTDPSAYRQEDEELLRYLNDGMRECSMLAPQLFYSTGDMQCAPGETEQGLSFDDAQVLVDVMRVKGGRAILPGDMNALSLFRPDWGQDAEGPALNWFKNAIDPLRFYLYPKAPAGQIIEVKYVRGPKDVLMGDEITDIPAAMQPALGYYIISRAEAKDDEHVLSGRSLASYQQFLSILKPA